ncbi:hypothetical protein [Candidatus Nardonella dryophthoridicola]|uniref:Uncharacterized protein n=1 Tax=endosymbiont of Metamasius hemipterus TaxID=204627 RepID=A0ABT0TWJ4_9GAMM|nr:hypothetical protein [Candidatus Nardonella dryophthoridicola]MCM0158304.1 hypothetical protein [endosymbiont of Metamasius hemipterus]
MTIILQIDIEKERISLGIKQLLNNIFDTFISNNKKNDILLGKILEIKDSVILINLDNNIIGNIKINNKNKNLKRRGNNKC